MCNCKSLEHFLMPTRRISANLLHKMNFDSNALNSFAANVELRAGEKRYSPYSIAEKAKLKDLSRTICRLTIDSIRYTELKNNLGHCTSCRLKTCSLLLTLPNLIYTSVTCVTTRSPTSHW